MMKGAFFQHANLLLFIVAPLLQRQGEPPVTVMLIDWRRESTMSVGLSLDLLGVKGYASKELNSATREGNRRNPII